MRIKTCERLIDLIQDSKLDKANVDWAIEVLRMEISRQKASWRLSKINLKQK